MVPRISGTPSYGLFLGEAMHECEWKRDEFKLKIGAFGAEPWTEEMRKKLESSLGIKAYDIYGLSEIAGPGVGYECEHQCGTHLNEDYFYPEILNPETGEPMPEGQLGELTFTLCTMINVSVDVRWFVWTESWAVATIC